MMSPMTNLAKLLAAQSGVPHEAVRKVLKALPVVLHQVQLGVPVNIRTLGTFKNVLRATRRVRSIQTGEVVDVPERRVLVFRASRLFRASSSVATK